MMEKLLAFGVAAVVLGVTFVGANASVAPLDAPSASDTAALGMRSNASFLAPMPVNYSMPLYQLPPLPPLAITRT